MSACYDDPSGEEVRKAQVVAVRLFIASPTGGVRRRVGVHHGQGIMIIWALGCWATGTREAAIWAISLDLTMVA